MTSLPLDNPLAPIFTVGQVADMLGVQQAFLRRLDEFDVVTPARSQGQQRRYSRADIERVQQVSSLMGDGFSLTAVRRVLELEAEVRGLRAQLREARARASRSPSPPELSDPGVAGAGGSDKPG